MRVISSEKIPIKMWLETIEDGAIEQAKNLANLPFAFKHVAIMPDCHQGYGMPIGGVLATKGVIIPNAVGVDIGCGMCAVKTDLKELSIDNIKNIFGGSKWKKGGIRANIPTGFNHQKKEQQWEGFNNYPEIEIIEQQIKPARKQLGTLGGGNHFIEIQKDQDNYIWIMIHSGSRNVGYKIANHYNKIAQRLCNMWHSNVPEFKNNDGLAFLPIGTKEAKEYLLAMNFALDFALENRLRMISQCKEEFLNVVDCKFEDVININHNYVRIENHYGSNVWVHRKGATSARLGEVGIIPGSQGTCSYIVKGLGNQESFMSCSHGAGRAMSRKKAQNNLILEEEQKLLDDKGILHAIRHKKDLDEASSAYKDIDIVMKNQKDLVEIVTKLTPLAVVKG